MLIRFNVENYRSFKDLVTFSMVAAKLSAKHKELDINNLFPISNSINLLKSAAIYGANASGKSNLLDAVGFMRQFVLTSSRESLSTDPIDV
ncbi:MAG: AAA family ATPase, partial [Planctomycetes bacterium]|nr:AAA family ATPase [Planctomycetota bacterium]